MIPFFTAGDYKRRKGISIIISLLVLVGMLFMMLGFFLSSGFYDFQVSLIRILFTTIIALIIIVVFIIGMIILIKNNHTRQEAIPRNNREHQPQYKDYEYKVKPQKYSKRSNEVYCQYCGCITTSDAIFCPNCGNKIE